MNIGKIKDILSGYGSEKGFDFVISKVRELSKNKQLKENINELIKLELSAFEKADRDGEYDFPGLIDLLKEFGSESFIESYVYAYIESDSLENKKELIRKECIRDTKANTQEAEQSVRRIVDRCFSIVDEHLLSCLPKEDLIQARLIIKNIEEALKQQTESIRATLQTSINELTALFTLQSSPTPYPACLSLITDNQAYLDAFTNPLFLEDEDKDEHVVSLAEMYISPSIKDKGIKASECIKKWYGTRTKPCLLIYGDAGVGKSSFVSKILADANGITEKSKTEFIFDSSKVMAVALRNHTDNINIQLTAEEILTRLFNCDFAEQLQDKLLILDGLDELCVLKHGFEGKIFLEKLSRLGYGYHVLVTSRESESYFTEPCNEEGLKTERLVWEEKQIKDWLNLYKAQKPRKEKWCIKFHEQFCSLETDDIRREIFCVPIILYICGTSETDIEDHNSIGSIYRDAFTKILLRKHLRGQSNISEFKEADKEANLTAWQFAKELAYQMFLLTTLDLVDDNISNDWRAIGFRNAKKRTKDILKEEYKIETPNLELKRELAVCPFAKENEKGGITFAHKTVYEYFTAVKLYEDYFAKFTKDYFENHQKEAPSEVIKASIEAFRYKAIPEAVFRFLYTMDYATFNGVSEKTTQSFDSEGFILGYIEGMKQHLFAKIGIEPAIEEYIYPPQIHNPNCKGFDNPWMLNSLNVQISRSYANLTWFLTGHGFTNNQNALESVEVGKLLSSADNPANFHKWKFTSANLFEAELTGSNMRSVHLDNTNLEGAKLLHTNLSHSSIKNSNFINADLMDARLNYATIANSDFRGANLHNANLYYTSFEGSCFFYASLSGTDLIATNLSTVEYLEDADLTDARYCSQMFFNTLFPHDFDPKEHGMTEIDIDDYPI